MVEREYVFGRSPEETQRQIRQAQLTELPLRHLFEDAGIGPGMRVLDLGSGAGEVATTAARLVGETGSVVGVDKIPSFVETARERARGAGYANVTFALADLDQNLHLDGEFDAVVGRRVLSHMADPTATLRRALRYLRSGGVVAFSEGIETVPPEAMAFPPSPLYARMMDLRQRSLRAAYGGELAMGWKLYETFLDAGLTEPAMRTWANVLGSVHPALTTWITNPIMRRMVIEHGLATETEPDFDAIAEQLREEFAAERKLAMGLLVIDAWARKP